MSDAPLWHVDRRMKLRLNLPMEDYYTIFRYERCLYIYTIICILHVRRRRHASVRSTPVIDASVFILLWRVNNITGAPRSTTGISLLLRIDAQAKIRISDGFRVGPVPKSEKNILNGTGRFSNKLSRIIEREK